MTTEERTIVADDDIEISVNLAQAEAPIWWRWREDGGYCDGTVREFTNLGFRTADLKSLSDSYIIEFARLHLDLD